MVTSNWKRFSNNPEENWANLNEDERLEWTEVFREALTASKCSKHEATFREGYKFVFLFYGVFFFNFNNNLGILTLVEELIIWLIWIVITNNYWNVYK